MFAGLLFEMGGGRRKLIGRGLVGLAAISAMVWTAERGNASRVSTAQAADAAAVGAADSVRQAPQVLKPGDHGVGRRVPNVAFKDLQDRDSRLDTLSQKRPVVIAMTSTSCPLSKKYLPTLARLEKEYADRGVAFLLVNPIASDSPDEMRAAVARQELKAPYVHDRDGTLARALGANSTTDILVIDAARTVVYHGAIDDQYGLGYALDKPRHSYLRDALNSLLANETLRIAATQAPGCTLEVDEPKDAGKTLSAGTPNTYHNRISRIVQNHCGECHRAGGVAPFTLSSRADLLSHKAMIRQVVERNVMPPWFAAPIPDGEATPWSNDRSLATADKADLLAWLKGDAPEGDAADAPVPRVFHERWEIGTPDVVLQLPRELAVKAEGTMPYEMLAVETKFDEDKWISAAEIRPTAREVVHHVLVFVQEADQRGLGGRGAVSEEGRGFLAAYVPGNSHFSYAPGFAKRVPKGARLIFQMHYTPNGTATTDRTQLALRFAPQPPEHEVKVVGIANTRFRIPPGASDYSDTATLKVPTDAAVLAFFPHMHLRGKAFRYDVTYPDARTETVLDVPRYDFNWQLEYRRVEPLMLPPGATIKVTATFDNSKDNPANPDPSKTVTWGPQTFDEMLLGYIEYYLPNGEPGGAAARSPLGDKLRERAMQLAFDQADSNKDGKLDLDEARKAFGNGVRFRDKPELLELMFKRLDGNADGTLAPEEFARLRELR